jgi:hypothetical protein
MTLFTPFRDLFRAANLRHGANGFTSLPMEGMLRIFSLWTTVVEKIKHTFYVQ